jgi:hypothetical protein
MATRTPKTAARKTARSRPPRSTHAQPARARAKSAPAAGPRANGAFAAMMREYAGRYPASRER